MARAAEHAVAPPPRIRRYQPIDVLTLAYLAVVFLAVALLGGHLERQVEIMAVHLVLFLVVRLLVPLARRSPHPLVGFMADVYPVALFSLLYPYANLANSILFREPFDPFFAGLDQAIFGVQPSDWLALNLGSPLLHEIVHAFYAGYYLMIPAVALIIYFRGCDRTEFRRFVFTVGLTFYASYLAFIALPVHGPFLLRGDDFAGGAIFVPFMDLIYAVGETGGGAFPSSHVAVATVCLIFCARHSKTLFAVWLVPFLGLVFATVYCRYHYAVDTLAGLPWGLLGCGIGVWVYDFLDGRRQRSAPAAPRPAPTPD